VEVHARAIEKSGYIQTCNADTRTYSSFNVWLRRFICISTGHDEVYWSVFYWHWRFYVLLHSKLGRWNFRQARVMPFVSTFWTKIGEKGTQSVYLGIGLGLIGIGCGLLIKSFV
jgi:hypothetical protein